MHLSPSNQTCPLDDHCVCSLPFCNPKLASSSNGGGSAQSIDQTQAAKQKARQMARKAMRISPVTEMPVATDQKASKQASKEARKQASKEARGSKPEGGLQLAFP
jgi:hypothetical protein